MTNNGIPWNPPVTAMSQNSVPTTTDYLTGLSTGPETVQTSPRFEVDEAEMRLIYSPVPSNTIFYITLVPTARHNPNYASGILSRIENNIETNTRRLDVSLYYESFEELIDSIDIVRATALFKLLNDKELGYIVNRFTKAKDLDFLCGHGTIILSKNEISASAKEKYADTYGSFNCNCDKDTIPNGPDSPFKVCDTIGENLDKRTRRGLTGVCKNFTLDIREVYACEIAPELSSDYPAEVYGFYAKIRTRIGIKPYMISSASANPFDIDNYIEIMPYGELEIEGSSIIQDRINEDSFLSAVGVNIS